MRLRTFLFRIAIAVSLYVVLLAHTSPSQQKVTVAYPDVDNMFGPTQVFQQGIVLPGSSSGAITINAPASSSNYTFSLPTAAGQPAYYLCVGSTLGVLTPLAYCAQAGGGQPLVSFTPSNLVSNPVPAGSSSTGSLRVTNTGNAVFTFTGSPFTLSGANSADFAVAGSSTCMGSGSIAAGANCIINITFTPGATGARVATLSVADNVVGTPQTISLSGQGL